MRTAEEGSAMGEAAADERRSQHLSFRIAGEEYAIPLLAVREIIQYDRSAKPTKVPGTPAWIHGVVNLRGSVVAVIDLAVKFGLSPATISRATCIVVSEVVLKQGQVILGVLTDEVEEVIELGSGEIQPPPAFGTQVRTEFLRGLGCLADRLVMMLDLDAALSRDELLAVRTAAAGQSAEAVENGEENAPTEATS